MTTDGEQLALPGLPRARRPRRPAASQEIAAVDPIARVAVDLPMPHLDRPFEYTVPQAISDAAVPGARVRVRFAGQDVDGFLLDRAPTPEHLGRLAPLRAVVSPEPVLDPQVLRLARAVADRYAGSLADVLRLAVPPRHARTENEAWAEVDPRRPAAPGNPTVSASAWTPYRGGGALLQRLAAGDSPRAVWSALPGPPGETWATAIAQAVTATLVSARGVLVVVPDTRDLEQVCAALREVGLPEWSHHDPAPGFVRLRADDGPSVRYRSFLAALRGRAPVVVGTRAAAFAPVQDLGLVVCWDDGDDSLVEPRAPYPAAREVLALRAELTGCAAVIGGFARSVEAQQLVATGWARSVEADRDVVRRRAPRVHALTSVELAREGPGARARLPSAAWRAARSALETGPVLVQVPRAGYVPVVACAGCRTPARCPQCHGPLGLREAAGAPQCQWCGALSGGWRCPECAATQLRSVRVGSERTAEELGRAFPGVLVRVSGSTAPVLTEVADRPALVVATPGAEPWAPSGYAAALLLDAAVATGRADLRGAEEALRRWLRAAALVRSAAEGGVVLVVGDGAPAPTQALVRWDPAGFAARELAERAELGLPPVTRTAAVLGPRRAVETLLRRAELPPSAEVLGPVPAAAPRWAADEGEFVRALVRAPRADGAALARALAAADAVRSARKEPGSVRIEVDPHELW